MRWIATLLVVLALTQMAPLPAFGDEIKVFDVCVTSARHGRVCDRAVEVKAGKEAFFRGSVYPPHTGLYAIVWGLEPHAATWTKMAHRYVHNENKRVNIGWAWQTTEQDVHNYASWRFRMIVPGHGQSRKDVRVRVVDR
jgi:hypothetical protein